MKSARTKKKTKNKTLVLHSLTKGGAGSLIKFYRDTLGLKILEDPVETQDDTGRWRFVVEHPFPEEDV